MRFKCMRASFLLHIFLLLLAAELSQAQFIGSAAHLRPEDKHSISYGPSVGWNLDRDAWFWGVAYDYGYVLNDRWSLAAALAFDQETEHRDIVPDKKVNTFTAIGTITYALNDYLSLTTGLGKGFLDDDNSQQRFRFTDGDLGTDLAVGLNFPWTDDRSSYLSSAYEYNISQKERTLSFDFGIALAF
jgi:long-subunit fatty acid transport protein